MKSETELLNADLPEGFKMTELGLLPTDWQVVKLENTTTTYSGGTPSRNTKEYWNGSIPWIKSGELNNSIGIHVTEFISEKGLLNSSTKYVDEGTLLVAMYGATAGKVGLVKSKMTINQAICAIKPNEYFHTCFYFYYFQQIREDLLSRRFGGAQPNLNQQLIKNIKIPLPPLPEQEKIATVLSAVQEAREKTQAVIKSTKELKKSLMKYLFTYGPVPLDQAADVKLKDTEIGIVPEAWETTGLSNVVDISYGVQAAVAHLVDPNIGIPILTNVNVTNDGQINISMLRYFEVPENKMDKYLLRKGDILFNWRSGSASHVGKTALFELNGNFTFSSFILRFRVTSSKLINHFLYHYFQFLKSIKFFEGSRQQSSVNSVYNASLSANIPVLLPSLINQQEIIRILASINIKLQTEESKKQALDYLFESLLNNLMTGKIRVNILEI